VSGIRNNLNKKPDLYAAAICIKVRSDHFGGRTSGGKTFGGKTSRDKPSRGKTSAGLLRSGGLPYRPETLTKPRNACFAGFTSSFWRSFSSRSFSPSLLFWPCYPLKYKVGSINLCSRESACTVSRLHHNRKIDTVLLKAGADARSSVPGRRPAAQLTKPSRDAGEAAGLRCERFDQIEPLVEAGRAGMHNRLLAIHPECLSILI
jgi:hypothetical protein